MNDHIRHFEKSAVMLGAASWKLQSRKHLSMPYAAHHPRTRVTSVSSVFTSLCIPNGPLEAHLWIVAGVEPSIIPRLAELIGESARAVCALIGISQSTLARKIAASSPLSTEQGARVYCVVLALDAALSLHEGDIVKCTSWLNRPARGLGGEKPVDLLSTAMGVQAVIDLAGRIEYGVY